jgi:hypothetical protein
MGDEKSITEKLAGAISKAADSVKSAVSHVIDTASDAAQHAMEANAERIARIPPAKTDPDQVAGATNEQLYIPLAKKAGKTANKTRVRASPRPKRKSMKKKR